MTEPDRMSTAEAAHEIGVSQETLARWRRRGYGPPVIELGPTGRKKLYDRVAVKAWLARQMRTPRREEPGDA